MSAIRFRRSFSRQRFTIVRTGRGRSSGSASQSGSLLSTLANVSLTFGSLNARLPVSISKITHPNAQMSARLSTGWPRACSGLMYAAVPSNMPTPVIMAGLVIVGDAVRSGS